MGLLKLERQQGPGHWEDLGFYSQCYRNPWKDSEQRRSVFSHECSRITLAVALRKLEGFHLPLMLYKFCAAQSVEGHWVGSYCRQEAMVTRNRDITRSSN